MEIKTNKDLLIVSSGGGFPQIENCLGCLLAIQELLKINLQDNLIQWRGTSAGGIVSTIIAMGYSVEQLIAAIRNTTTNELIIRRWFWPIRVLNGGYIYNRSHLEDFIESFIGQTIVDNVKVMVTRQNTEDCEEMPGSFLSTLATSAIEGIFKLPKINGIRYKDGGYTNNVPLEPYMLNEYKHIIIILPPKTPLKKHQSSIQKLLEGIDTKVSQEVNEAERTYSDIKKYPNVILFRPPPINTDILSWSKDFELINYAYQYSINKIKSLGE